MRALALGLFLATLVIRSIVVFGLFNNFRADPDGYRHIAHHLLAQGIFGRDAENETQPAPTAYRPPLYPLLLSVIAAGDDRIPSLNVAITHVLLGVATVGVTFLLGWRLALGPWSLLAAGLVAVDPILLNQSTLVMTETLATLLGALCLWSLARFHSAPNLANAGLAGAMIGMAILCRPTFLPWLLPVALVMAWNSGGRQSKVLHVAALIGCTAVVLAPWTVRNYRVFGKPIATTTHGGYTLLLGNNESYYAWVREGKPIAAWDARSLKDGQAYVKASSQNWDDHYQKTQRAELVYDAACYEEAQRTIRRQPVLFVGLSAYRIAQLWSPLPNLTQADRSGLRRLLRYPIAAWYAGIFACALLATLAYRNTNLPAKAHFEGWLRSPWIYGITLCLVFTAIHSIYWSNLRMRAPLMPFIACAAAAGAEMAVRWLRRNPGSDGVQRSAQ
jgi:hypothetical protein